MSRARRIATTIMAVSVIGATALGPGAHAAPSPSSRQASWLAIGDSISAGFGLAGTSQKRSVWGQNCRRAEDTEAGAPRAWPLVAAERLRGSGAAAGVTFTACAGSISDDWGSQVAEAYVLEKAPLDVPADRSSMEAAKKQVGAQMEQLAKSGWRWRVISLTFGANNISLGGAVEQCLDTSREGDPMTWSSDRWGTCSGAVDTLRARTRVFTGEATGALARGRLPLWRGDGESLLRSLSSYVTDGGTVVVMGYPQLFAAPDKTAAANSWPAPLFQTAFNCDGMTDENVTLVRGAIADLNRGLAQAVAKADRSLAGRAHVVFVDPNSVYERNGTSHGLCSPQPWVNGPFEQGALHPEEKGQAAMGTWVAQELRHVVR